MCYRTSMGSASAAIVRNCSSCSSFSPRELQTEYSIVGPACCRASDAQTPIIWSACSSQPPHILRSGGSSEEPTASPDTHAPILPNSTLLQGRVSLCRWSRAPTPWQSAAICIFMIKTSNALRWFCCGSSLLINHIHNLQCH